MRSPLFVQRCAEQQRQQALCCWRREETARSLSIVYLQLSPYENIYPKKTLGCSSKTCVWGDLGLDTLKSRRDRAKLKWWYKVSRLLDNRYPKQLLSQEWEIKPRKGRQRKTWSRTIADIFHSLSLDKGEILDDMHEGNSSLKSFMACVEDDLREKEAEELGKGLIVR